ncbi:MAG: asparagine synthase-related protein [Nocardioidaceae bacterium]|nr:asparagine synthase-related protein [Nocardioidaceae bacterium]
MLPVGSWSSHEAGLAVLTGPGPASASLIRAWLDGACHGGAPVRQGFVAVLSRPDGSGVIASGSRWEQSALYAADGPRLLVGTHPRDLIEALPAPPPLSVAKLVDLLALYDAPDTTVHDGIRRVPLGHALLVGADGTQSLHRWFDPSVAEDRGIRVADAPALLREAVAEAVAASLPEADGPVAAAVSGGLDSSMVVASAARHRAITGLTHVPLPGTPDPHPGWDASDASYVAALASHVGRLSVRELVNDQRVHPLDACDQAVRRTWHPVFNPGNQAWVNQLVHAAEELGSPVLLTGASGNATYSRDRAGIVRELVVRRRAGALAREVRARAAADGGWAGALRSVGREAAPPALLARTRRLRGITSGDAAPGADELPYLVARISDAARAELAELADDHVPDRAEWTRFALMDSSRIGSVQSLSPAVWWSDPLSDPGVIATALRLPEEAWLAGGRSRGLARAASAGLVPDVIRLRRTHGAQAADTATVVAGTEHRYRELLERFRASATVPAFVDLDRLEASLGEEFRDPTTALEWQGVYGRAFAVGQFAVWYEDEVLGRGAGGL